MYTWNSSEKLGGVRYDIRGKVLQKALALESEGHTILKLNIGNTAPFGIKTEEKHITTIKNSLNSLQGYSHSQGILEAREAIVDYYKTHNIHIRENDVYMGNGVSELIVMCMQNLCNPQDEILVPSPDYPLWTAAVTLAGGKALHYVCDEESDWQPDIQDIKKKITTRTKALVLINPNNPTGAVYTKEVLQDIAKLCKENNILVFSDEIYEKVVYGGKNSYLLCPFMEDFPCIFFGGLSKAFRMPGFRCGWMGIHDPHSRLTEFRKGLDILSSMRLCSNTPSQSVIKQCLHDDNSIYEMTSPGGRLYEQKKVVCEGLKRIPGISFVEPKGAMYIFPKIDVKKFSVTDDEKFVLDFLEQHHVLLVHGTGFNWIKPDHFRMVLLAGVSDLQMALQKLETFLKTYRQ